MGQRRNDELETLAKLPSRLSYATEKLFEVLREEERIVAALDVAEQDDHSRTGIVAATTERLLVITGKRSSLNRRVSVRDLPYTSITSVRNGEKAFLETLEVDAPGLRVRLDRMVGAAAFAETVRSLANEAAKLVAFPAPPPDLAPGTPSSPNDGIGNQLEKIAALRERGLLSETEYAAAKARVLGTQGPPLRG